MIEEELARPGLSARPRRRLELGLQEFARSAVVAGYGVTFIRPAIEADIAAGTVDVGRVEDSPVANDLARPSAGRAETPSHRLSSPGAVDARVIVAGGLEQLPDARSFRVDSPPRRRAAGTSSICRSSRTRADGPASHRIDDVSVHARAGDSIVALGGGSAIDLARRSPRPSSCRPSIPTTYAGARTTYYGGAIPSGRCGVRSRRCGPRRSSTTST